MPVTLYDDQQRVYDAVKAYLREPYPRRPYFFYNGAAGTGKTEVLAVLAQEFPNSVMCAFAGKSASVLRNRTGLDVSTVHSAIYDFKGHVRNEDTGIQTPVFRAKDIDFTGELAFLDECGTIGNRLGFDLETTGARIIACGDLYQLQPVRDSRYFDVADAEITEVRRQAWDSPIIRQAHAVKRGDTYAPDGDDFKVVAKSDVTKTPESLGFGGIALCWRNITRQKLNFSRRRVFGHDGYTLRCGEPVMVLRNDHKLRVYNGEIYKVVVDRAPGDDLQVLAQDGRKIVLRNVTCEGIDPEFDLNRNEDDYSPVCLAYATTVHKFIGSEDDDILLIDEYTGNERAEFIYTGITRAAKRIMIVKA